MFYVEKNHIAWFYIRYIGGTMYIMDVRGLMGWGDADMRGGPDGGVLFCMVGGAMVVDGEDMSATVIAVVARCLLINPCPRLCRGNPYHGGGYGSRSP